jgi:hypothetical protein
VEPSRNSKANSRASLACIQCRSRHLRCDATKPVCSRCQQENSECTYMKSRRGARTRTNVLEPHRHIISPPPTSSAGSLSLSEGLVSHSDSPRSIPHRLSDGSGNSGSSSASPGSDDLTSGPSFGAPSQEPLLDLYYTYFHTSHPCALPKNVMKQKLNDDIPGVKLLTLVMRFIGCLYAPIVCSKICSQPLEEQVKVELAVQQLYTTGYEIQALTLYSLAIFWCDDLHRSREILDDATTKALALGMNLREFATDHSGGDPVLAESWRRTWWLLYLTDAHLASSTHATYFTTSQRNITATVDLPCEESQYISGVCPHPTLFTKVVFRSLLPTRIFRCPKP